MPLIQPAPLLLSCHSVMNVGSSAGKVNTPSIPAISARHIKVIR